MKIDKIKLPTFPKIKNLLSTIVSFKAIGELKKVNNKCKIGVDFQRRCNLLVELIYNERKGMY